MQKILVIEDEQGIREAIVDILELEGYAALSAGDGVAGVALARQEQPNLVLCDIMMPFLDGYGVLTELRKHTETATTPFVFLTAKSTTEDIRQGMNLGADDYLTKPFRAEDLLTTIQTRLERQSRLADRLQQRIDAMHTDLMSVLPHELNTPLHGILAGVEFLREEMGSLAQSDIEELIWIIHQSALRMRRLVSNVLLHAQLEGNNNGAGEVDSRRAATAISVAPIIQKVSRQEAAAVTREPDLHLELQAADVNILPADLSKIVEELVNNGFKYSKPGSPVSVTTHLQGREFWLTTKSFGRGMSKEEIAAIGAFRQFDRHRYEQQGLGLGLTIVQRLLNLYQGKLAVESEGEETLVRITLPISIERS